MYICYCVSDHDTSRENNLIDLNNSGTGNLINIIIPEKNNCGILIDINSPEDNEDVIKPISNDIVTNILNTSFNSNPFDTVADLAQDTSDPFELVFKSAYNSSKTIEDNLKTIDSDNNSNIQCKTSVENEIFLKNSDEIIGKSDSDFNRIKNEIALNNSADKNKDTPVISSHPLNEIKKSFINNLDLPEISKSSSLDSLDFSSEEAIKASIAKRINKCVEKVLNNINDTDPAISVPSNNETVQKVNRRSLPVCLNKNTDECNETKNIVPLRLMFSSPAASLKKSHSISEISPVINCTDYINQSSLSNNLNQAFLLNSSSAKSNNTLATTLISKVS